LIIYSGGYHANRVKNISGGLKHEKELILALVLLLAIFCFTACDSDDDEPNATSISTADELASAFKNGGSYIMQGDISITTSDEISVLKDVTIDLNNHSLMSNAIINIGSDSTSAKMSLKSGNLTFTDESLSDSSVTVAVGSGSTFSLDHVVYTTKTGCGPYIVECSGKQTTIEVKHSQMKVAGGFGLGTNATTPTTSDAKMIIEDSTIEAGDCALLFNVKGVHAH